MNEFIRRYNWGIQTGPYLCTPFGNQDTLKKLTNPKYRFYDRYNSQTQPELPRLFENGNQLDINLVFFRVERQNFTKLESGSILFTIHTYIHSLMELRDLLDVDKKVKFIEAINGIKGEVAEYKDVNNWKKAVEQFIFGETSGKNISIFLFIN